MELSGVTVYQMQTPSPYGGWRVYSELKIDPTIAKYRVVKVDVIQKIDTLYETSALQEHKNSLVVANV